MDKSLAAAIGAAVVFRILMWKATRSMISFDEANYLRLAGAGIQDGLGAVVHPYWSPFYPLLTACFSWITHHPEATGRSINILAGAGILPILYHWTRRFFGAVAARWTVWFTALYPPFAFGDTAAMPEPVYTLTALLGMALAWRALNRLRWSYALAAGLVWGFTYLTKPEGIGFVIIFTVYGMAWLILRRRIVSSLRTGLVILTVLAGFLAAASPYLIYLKKQTGQWTVSTKGMLNQQMEAAVAFNDGPMKDPFFHITSDGRYLPYDMGMHFGNFHKLNAISEGQDRIVSISVSRLLLKYGQNCYQLYKETLPQLFGLILLMLFASGFFTIYDAAGKRRLIYLGLFVGGYWFGMVPLFHINIRYLMPLFPVLFIWTGAGSSRLGQWFAETCCTGMQAGKRRMAVLFQLILLSVVILPETAVIVRQNRPGPDLWAQPLELREAGTWLKEHTESPPRLMTLNKAIDFYAGQYRMTEGASFSYDSVDRNIVYAKTRHCDFLVFTSRYLSWFPNLRPLIAGPVPESLEKVYEKSDSYGITVVIYRLKDG